MVVLVHLMQIKTGERRICLGNPTSLLLLLMPAVSRPTRSDALPAGIAVMVVFVGSESQFAEGRATPLVACPYALAGVKHTGTYAVRPASKTTEHGLAGHNRKCTYPPTYGSLRSELQTVYDWGV